MKRKKIISVAVLMILLFNLSNGVFAGGTEGTTRPTIASIPSYQGGEFSPCGGTEGSTRPD